MHYLLLAFLASLLVTCVKSVQGLSTPNKRIRPGNSCSVNIDTIFVFGDSYSAIGGEQGSLATWSLFETSDSVTNNPILKDVSSSGGANWNEYLTGCYEGRPQDCRRHLFNVAYNGATVDKTLVQPWRPIVTDFKTQTQQWQNYVKPKVQWNKAFAAVWFGINDVAKSNKTSDADIGALLTEDVEIYFQQLELLYNGGLRTFVINNVPPFDRSPLYRDQAAKIGPRIGRYNALLDSNINAFTGKHQDVKVIKIDAHERFSYYLDNAAKYGITDTANFCDEKDNDQCLPLNRYFWQDDLHPTYPVHKAFADDIAAELAKSGYCL
ncbi:hypothetical protein BJV82DRAFT_590900 [Fennellomyces sp. T-0311]|nr:hypothetical protein BJV82DRAFT_590900 [Fennellomyces sp. T-0311]